MDIINTFNFETLKETTQTQFFADLTDPSKSISVNGNPTPLGYWNLIISIRDVSLYSKGIKPHRFWKISDVKKYFGITGNAIELKQQLEELKNKINQ